MSLKAAKFHLDGTKQQHSYKNNCLFAHKDSYSVQSSFSSFFSNSPAPLGLVGAK